MAQKEFSTRNMDKIRGLKTRVYQYKKPGQRGSAIPTKTNQYQNKKKEARDPAPLNYPNKKQIN